MSTGTDSVTPASADLPRLRDTVYSLTAGTLLLALGFASLAWVYGSLRFVFDGVWPAFGTLAVTVLAVLLSAYGWALLVRSLTDVVARVVAEGVAR